MASLPPAPSAAGPQATIRISSFDQYLLTYFPRSQEAQQAQALSPQEFGVSMARESLQHLREALAKRGAA